jgi:hypothetical protein
MTNIQKRFMKGLEKYGLTIEEVRNNWYYSGGNMGSHLNYFKLKYKQAPFYEEEDECVCGHSIKENCYITNDEEVLILGNCCIKRFMPKNKSGRTCERCKNPHKNRVVNLCNECRYKYCKDCGIEKFDKKYKLCYNCWNKF